MIKLTNIALQVGQKSLFENLDFVLHPKQRVGLVGRNGCGKSTLFSLLLRNIKEDSGEVWIPPQWVVGHLEQEVAPLPISAMDYVLAGDTQWLEVDHAIKQAEENGEGERLAQLHLKMQDIDGYTAQARAGRLLAGLGFAANQYGLSVASFSGGWRMRLNLARTLMQKADLLLLDEPTNHLDLEAIIWLEQFLRSYPGSLVIISHDREFLDQVVEGIYDLSDRQLKFYTGNYSSFERQKAEQIIFQQQMAEKINQQRQHLQKFIDRFKAKATKAKQAQSRIKALEKLPQIQAAQFNNPFSFEIPNPEKNPNPLLQVQLADIQYGERRILEKINFSLAPGQRIGLLGVNGAGKSTFIKLVAGELTPTQGEIIYHPDTRIGYFAQHQLDRLILSETPLQHLQRIDSQAREQVLRNFLGSFHFHGDIALTPIQDFSGGEKARLALALLIWRRPNVLLLDEPTNHLDREMQEALNQALQLYEGAIILISHDRYLLRSTCDELYLVDAGKLKVFPDDLDAYVIWRKQQTAGTEEKTDKKNNPQIVKTVVDPNQKKIWQNRVKTIETRLPQLQKDLAKLEERLGDSQLYESSSQASLQELIDTQKNLQAMILQLEDEYLDLLGKL